MRRSLPVGAACVALGVLAAVGASGTAQAAARHELPGSVPAWANASALRGHAAASDHVGFRVYLGWRNADEAAQLATAVSTPGSPSYRQFLTPQQFRSRFAPAQSDVSAVQSWLRSAGFAVNYTPQNGHYVSAEGTVAQAEAAFSTTIGTYAKGDLVLHAPETALSVPASLGAVTAVVGLDDSAALVTHSAPPSAAFVNAEPCSAYWGEKTTTNTSTPDKTTVPGDYPYAPCGYVPAQLRGAYGVAHAPETGAGQTVAIIDAYASPTIAQDANQYSANYGLPTMDGSQFQQVVAPGTYNMPVAGASAAHDPVQDPQGWYGEETLDVEAVHTMAPGAKIVYVSSPNNYQDMDAALNHVVDQHLASIVSNSYGWSGEALPNGYIKPQLDTMIQAVTTGIGVYFSSGDSGDETGGDPANAAYATPDWPASSPWVTAVGGTSLAVSKDNGYLWEAGWETGKSTLKAGDWSPSYPGKYLYGSGGGTSRLFAQPSYQAKAAGDLATKYSATPMRVVPDIAALGDPTTGMRVGQTQTFPDGSVRYSEYRIGGTSLASPLMAGIMALVQQRAGHTIGFANPLIYAKADKTPSAFHDVLGSTGLGAVRSDYVNGVDDRNGYAYTLRSIGDDAPLTIHTGAGYDDVTGVGTPNGDAFLTALSSSK